LARALSVVNIHLNRERAAFRFRSQVANRAPNRLEIVNPAIQALASRTPISISTVLRRLAGVGGQQNVHPFELAGGICRWLSSTLTLSIC